MPDDFTIAATFDELTIDAETRRATAEFTVTNRLGDDVRARVRVAALEGCEVGWFTIQGEEERGFAVGEFHTYQVAIEVPDRAPAGQRCRFQLEVATVRNPDREQWQGQPVGFDVPESALPPLPPSSRSSWLWWAVGAVGTAVLVGVLLWIFRPLEGPPRGASFDPRQTRLDQPDMKKFNPKKEITLEAWFKTDTLGARQVIIGKYFKENEQPYYQYNLELRDDGKPYFALSVDGKLEATLGPEVKQQEWHHVAATYDGDEMRLYLDGEECKPHPVKGELVDYTTKVFIGGKPPPERGIEGFAGHLAEVRIWDVARSQDEIKRTMHDRIKKADGLVWSSSQEELE